MKQNVVATFSGLFLILSKGWNRDVYQHIGER